MERLSPMVIFRAHWKALSNYARPGKPVPDRATRAILTLTPVLVGIGCFHQGVLLKSPDALLAAMALLSGGSLTAFTHLAGVRQHFTQREDSWGEAERFARDSLDETAAHLLQASYFSIIASVVLVVVMNIPRSSAGIIAHLLTAAAAAVCSYVALLFLMALPRLYDAYALASRVRPEMSGTHID